MENKKKWILFGVGTIAIQILLFVIYTIAMFSLKIMGKIDLVADLDLYIVTLTMSLVIFCVLALFDLLPKVMIDVVLGFHRRFNSENMDKNPIRFVVNHQLKIQKVCSCLIFMGSILIFYAVWVKLKI
jgi:hypothetical protein